MRAEEIIAERQVIQLSPDAAEAFEAALARPAQVNENLRRSLQRSATFTWLD
ncbi:type II toxin -antitoxin system TacA 1-like antitoxin [[Mycobacterium] vasticus]|uniref:DUF1778 domain-containing protein n=1 Tax=[Mycobacterium] vasticus TaxID=2875777 RepID=A0ABU5Z2P8_9MYCO|nr:DUF1778 domain-containing protein [Mycolicibacter sp. MYC017]MEB3071643.1 DUF1778 domain-containing protein [Mycolicibacter sp. MYC017]